MEKKKSIGEWRDLLQKWQCWRKERKSLQVLELKISEEAFTTS